MKIILAVDGTAESSVRRIFDHHMNALIPGGVRIVILDPIKDQDEELPKGVDGLLLLGGSDIHPLLYGQKVTWSVPGPFSRDWLEFNLANQAIEMGVPILGLCRGHQMLCVAAGGTLYQDVHREAGARIQHGGSMHRIVYAEKPLANFLPKDMFVNSYHHQAVKDVPPGFSVAAVATDGIIEAIYSPGYLGVQWHPEMAYATEPKNWLELFRWFTEYGLQPVEMSPRNDAYYDKHFHVFKREGWDDFRWLSRSGYRKRVKVKSKTAKDKKVVVNAPTSRLLTDGNFEVLTFNSKTKEWSYRKLAELGEDDAT